MTKESDSQAGPKRISELFQAEDLAGSFKFWSFYITKECFLEHQNYLATFIIINKNTHLCCKMS